MQDSAAWSSLHGGTHVSSGAELCAVTSDLEKGELLCKEPLQQSPFSRVERRVHPLDKQRAPYTFEDFVEFQCGDQGRAWRMWQESCAPTAEDHQTLTAALPPGIVPLLEALPEGQNVAVVTLRGSLCPITLAHVLCFSEAKRVLLREEGSRAPARLETFSAVLGFVSLNGDGLVSDKLQKRGEQALDFGARWHLVELTIADEPWLACEATEGDYLPLLRAKWPGLTFVHFSMNGADDVVRHEKYSWSCPESRFIVPGRTGFTEMVREGMRRNGVDAEDGCFVVLPDLPDISSTEARRALRLRDRETLNGMLHPRVIEWCLNCGWVA